MKVACLPALALLSAALVHGGAVAKEDKTITKVVKLLQDMMKKSKEEADKERVLYGKFKCYCDTNEDEKTTSIRSLTKQIGLLDSAIESLQAQNGELSAQTAQLKADMAENEAGRKEATNIRDKANKVFTAEEKDLKQGIGQMDEAIKVIAAIGGDQTLAKSGADHEKFMAGSKTKGPLLVALGAEVKSALAAASVFLSPGQKQQVGSFMQAPFTGTYTAQSGQVVGILKDMKKTFETNLASAIGTEKSEKEAYDKFMKTKKDSFDSMEETYTEKQEDLSSNDGALTSKKKQLSAATTDKEDAESFLAKLTDMCAEKAKEYEERNLMRANEEAAVAQAISILNSDAAFETFGTVSATSSGKTGAASFLQLVQRHGEGAARRQLESLLQIKGSARLARLLESVEAGNPFEKVLLEIGEMKKLNAEEGKEDKKKLDWCKSEREENNKNLKDRESEIVTLGGEIDKLETTINDPTKGLKQQLADTEKSLLQNDDSQKTETKQRTEENVAYQADVRNLVDAEDLLTKAVAVLKKYYAELAKKIADEKAAAMVQEDPTPPKTWDTFEGQSSKGGDAVTMLEFILKETQKEEATAHADEEKAQASYEDSMTDLKKEQAKLEGSLTKLNEELATSEKSLIEKNEDHKDTENAKAKIEAYLLQIKPGCDFITTNFDKRETNRKTETEALEKAVTLIKKTPAYLAAVQAAKEKSFGKCKSKCVKNEPGAQCQACLADVTVPAYCAGHKAAPGC